jgi:hypothetical protein
LVLRVILGLFEAEDEEEEEEVLEEEAGEI